MGSLVDTIFSPPTPQLPAPAPPVRIPDENDPKILEERRRREEMQRASRGRRSTELDGGSGAPATYTNTSLGV